MKPEHIASYQHVLLTKKSPALAYPVRKRVTKKGPDSARPPEVWEQHERDGHMPKFPDRPVCVQEHGSVVKRFSSTTNSLHTLHLDPGF